MTTLKRGDGSSEKDDIVTGELSVVDIMKQSIPIFPEEAAHHWDTHNYGQDEII